MIFGTGTDIIETNRIQKAVENTSGFRDKIFTPAEQQYCEAQKAGKYSSYAARFAAKEAFFKALGTGYRYGMTFQEIEIINNALGKPEIVVRGKVKNRMVQQGISQIHLSLSHTRKTAIAFVILEKE